MFKENRKPPYNEEFYNQLLDEGYTPNEAALMAATEMDGVALDSSGGLDGNQTYCDHLEYDEALPLSTEATTAATKNKNDAEQAAKEAGYADLRSFYEAMGLDVRDL